MRNKKQKNKTKPQILSLYQTLSTSVISEYLVYGLTNLRV